MHAVNPLETPAFKRFFRDSAVVDREGRPMPVYHGTTAGDFEAFRAHYRKDEQLGFGIHFAESYELADMYAHDPSVRRRGVKKPRVIGAYLSIQRPLYADRVVFEGTLEYALAVELAGVKLKRMPHERDDKGRRMLYMQACIDATGVERAERLIRQAGYDGVCYTATITAPGPYGRVMSGGGAAWVVFEANQIKSTDNVGTYNPEDPRMRHNPTKPPYSLYTKRGPRPWRIGAEDLQDLDLGSRPKVPDIDPYREDLQDDHAPASPEDILRTYNPGPGVFDVYLAWVPLSELPSPILVEEEDTLENRWECQKRLRAEYRACCEAEGADEDLCEEEHDRNLEECLAEAEGGYDWTELQMGTRRGGYPAPKLYIDMKELPQEGVWERGEMSYLDGNHRMRFFSDNDFAAVLLWVVQRVPAASARRNPTPGISSPFPPDFSTSYYPDFPPETWSVQEVEDLLGLCIEYGFPPPFLVENVPDRGPLEISVWGGGLPEYFNTWHAAPHQGGYLVEGPA
jgi:hypothetical protein